MRMEMQGRILYPPHMEAPGCADGGIWDAPYTGSVSAFVVAARSGEIIMPKNPHSR